MCHVSCAVLPASCPIQLWLLCGGCFATLMSFLLWLCQVIPFEQTDLTAPPITVGVSCFWGKPLQAFGKALQENSTLQKLSMMDNQLADLDEKAEDALGEVFGMNRRRVGWHLVRGCISSPHDKGLPTAFLASAGSTAYYSPLLLIFTAPEPLTRQHRSF